MDLPDPHAVETPGSARDRAAAERRDAILEAAKAVFLEEGYELASMDRIAERAGTTKRTVYDRMGPKEALFEAVVERVCANVKRELPGPDDLPADPRVGLAEAAARTFRYMISPNCVGLIRLVGAEAARRPRAVATLREAYAVGETKFRAYLDACVAAGSLRPHDTALSARLFCDVVSHAASHRALLGEDPTDETARRATAAVAELLLDRWGA
ncbi:TetR/AcrR family transcriptional regulator [Caulobacter sp. KR2-114]|uniref:TetR/AcrR family transcriptional regulator n=1 Tax=Caulobacter sp. KR2-114 TaxID=3400912 RepID=UPI003C0339DB